ncbi:metallophosphoesterase family protein [Mangrovivirga cuniculi]|uniref:Metallophosphoesterase n=1 Tax=Mangrovivirga cuniculi TaxID=2715131 RepID=A0A4D7JJQ7_9BACT|nr:metallophosphoesterase [Mangrovivirga cuniculi]QCK15831.1 metallophosphoesterase [Mangrovivirga cuniculi]
MRLHYLFYAVLSIFITACDLFEYSAHQITPDQDEKDVNLKNIDRILSLPVSDTLKIAFISDSQRFYDETEIFVDYFNTVSEEYDFVIHGGDISDFGLAKEFLWINDILSRLEVPYLTVIGNHDIPVYGHEAYRKIYGPDNYTFTWNDHRFIFLNTNSLEYGYNGLVPDLGWLQKQISERKPSEKIILISHMGPESGEFDPKLAAGYRSILKSAGDNLLFTLHGHSHEFKNGMYPQTDIPFWVTTSMDKRAFTKVRIWEEGYDFKKIEF